MHRRPLAPTRAASAAWARRLAVAAALLAGAALIAAHHPKVPADAALAALALALAGAALAILCGLQAMRTIWRTGQPGLGRAVFGLVLAAATLAYPGYLAAKVSREPLVTAAGTAGAASPPLSRSVKSAAVRGLAVTEAPVPASLAAADPITLDMSSGDAFDTVEDAVRSLRWRMIEAVPPGGRLGLGHLDAIAFSPVMHLPQDIAIRVTPLGGQTRIDVLSVTRIGMTDLGEGAASIRKLSDAVAAQTDD